MAETLEVTSEARKEILDLIDGDVKKRKHVRIFIQGYG